MQIDVPGITEWTYFVRLLPTGNKKNVRTAERYDAIEHSSTWYSVHENEQGC